LIVLSVALVAGGTNLDHAAAVLREGGQGVRVSLALAGVATAMVTLVEAGHLGFSEELSGRHLALVELAGQLRLLAWFGLLAALFLPFGLAPEGAGPVAWLVGLLAWAAKVAVLAGGLLLGEAAAARMRVFRAVEFLGVATLIALLAAVFLFISQRGA
jgi:formate hydrogenlyase subunit 4